MKTNDYLFIEEYLQYYPSNTEALSKYYDENTVWEDLTFYPNQPFRGKEAIVGLLDEFSASAEMTEWKGKIVFISDKKAVVSFVLNQTIKTETGELKTIKGIKGVSIIDFMDGKIIKHVDITDKDAYDLQYE